MKWLVGRFKYAFEGLGYAFKDKSIAFQCFLGVLAIVAGIVFQCSMIEWLWIFLAIVLVVSFEIINSCIEGLVDYISLKRDPRAKKIKDMAAAAVFLISCFAMAVAIIVFVPKLINLL